MKPVSSLTKRKVFMYTCLGHSYIPRFSVDSVSSYRLVCPPYACICIESWGRKNYIQYCNNIIHVSLYVAQERKKLLKNSVDSRHSDSVDSGHSESVNSGHSESVNSGHPESVNSRHSQFVSPRAKLPPHDCEIKIAQFKKSISDGLGKEYGEFK